MIKFRHRAREVSRIEAFSDIVFGFALTLIVISLEVPKSYKELMHEMRGFPGFAICFAVLMWIWYLHHTYFRRFGMTDVYTIVLNTILLFLVLSYVYPLKFVFGAMTGAIDGGDGGDPRMLLLIYGLGFVGIFVLFFLLYLHAHRKREQLELNEFELHDTETAMWMYGSYVVIGVVAIVLAQVLPYRLVGIAGWTYSLLGPVSAIIGYKRGYARYELHNRHVAAAQARPKINDAAAVPTVAANGPK